MKNTRSFLFLLVGLTVLAFQSCVKDKCEREITYTKYTPVYETIENVRIPIQMESNRTLQNPGKIYFYNEFIFINEKREGIHIFDNSQPEDPKNVGFIPIPGNVDIAIRGDVLFADNYMDLLAINISNLMSPVLEKRLEDVFPTFGNSDQGVLVYYDEEEITEMVDCNTQRPWGDDVLTSNGPTIDFESADGSAGNAAPSGIGGSLARFSLYDNYLYAIDQSNIYIFDINTVTNPTEVDDYPVGWNIETLYAFGDKLFVGSQAGMIILDASNPAAPQYLSEYNHWTACDPVFVKDNYAYVTLRSGTLCNGSTLNQLDLIDISDLLNPTLVKEFPMDNPHGLSIKDDNLFLCEGDNGLKVFDIAEPEILDEHLLSRLTSVSAVDVIVLPGDRNVLLVVGEDGFYQLGFDDPENLETLSFIPVEP